MNRPTDLAAEFRAYFAANSDPKLAAKWACYFEEGHGAWNLLDSQRPLWNERQDEWLERYKKLGLRGFQMAGALLFESGKYEECALRFASSASSATMSMRRGSLIWAHGSGTSTTGRTPTYCAAK